jgi:hypothetical protein
MKTKRLLFFFVLLVVLPSVCFTPLTKAANTNIPKYGVNIHIESEYPACASVLSDLREGGVYWIRTDMYTPSLLTSFWNDMKNEDIKVLGLLTQYPSDGGLYGSQDWQTYVQSMVNAAPDIPAWEIGNEPEQTWWSGSMTPQTYVTYLQQAYTIIKVADPNALIIGPAVSASSNGAQFLSSIKSLGAFNYLDAISVHYYVTLGATDLQSIESVVAGAKPIWITETGYQSTNGGSEAAQNSYVQNYLNSTSGILGSDPSIKVIIYYDLNDEGDGWGLNNGYPSYTPKQAYATFKSYLTVASSSNLPQEVSYGIAVVLIVVVIAAVVLMLKKSNSKKLRNAKINLISLSSFESKQPNFYPAYH